MDTYCPYCMNPASLDGTCPHCGKHPADYQPSGHHFPPGRLLHDRYLVGRVLGEGGFGITYLGRDTLLNYRVAVKEYFPNQLVRRDTASTVDVTCHTNVKPETFTKFRKRFLDEARVMASLQNIPEIVRVTDFFLENNTAYIVMELLEGETLEALLSRQTRIPAPELLSLLKPLMKAMQKMHDAGIIHRDISPNNIMVQPDGKVKLLDFGCARDFAEQGTMTVMLKHGYAPVEQYDGHGQGPWTDVYALSAVIYRALTGKVPPPAIKRTRLHDPLEAPNEKGAALSPVQEKALLKGLAVEPGERCQSIANLYAPLYGETIGGFDWNLDMDEEPSEAEKREQERKRQEALKQQELEEARRRREEEQARQKEEARQRKAAAAQKKAEERRRKAEERKARQEAWVRQKAEKAQARSKGAALDKTEVLDETVSQEDLEKRQSVLKSVKIGIGAAAAVLVVVLLSVLLFGPETRTIAGQRFAVDEQILNLSNTGLQDLSVLQDFSELTELYLAENQISNLYPLRELTNLTVLNLRGNQIQYVAPLKNLTNLERLVLEDNPVGAGQLSALQTALPKCTILSDVQETSIAGETFSINTTELDLSEKELTNITSLSLLIHLEVLDLLGNRIDDIRPLSGLTNLKELDLSANEFADLTPLSGLVNLQKLRMVAGGISDISALSSLSNLEELTLTYNHVSDVSPLSGLTNLKELDLHANEIADLTPLSGLTNLQKLLLGSNDFRDVSALKDLTNLKELELSQNHIRSEQVDELRAALPNCEITFKLEAPPTPEPEALPASGSADTISIAGETVSIDTTTLELDNKELTDISALSRLSSLRELNLHANKITDITPLSGLTNLQKLWLGLNDLSDISALSGLTNLEVLYLFGNDISDISALKDLTSLTSLSLSGNQIKDISALKDLTNLTALALQRNQIRDVSVLKDLTNLEELQLNDNLISTGQLVDLCAALPNCNIKT